MKTKKEEKQICWEREHMCCPDKKKKKEGGAQKIQSLRRKEKERKRKLAKFLEKKSQKQIFSPLNAMHAQ